VPPLLVNIGCGSNWHPDWVNLDVRPVSPSVRVWDAESGLPFKDGIVDVCYASHVLEHLSPEGARSLLIECLRVLRPGSVIRLAVPDLEMVAREYLRVFAQADAGDSAAAQQYEWITLELLDQLVREESGGAMARYLQSLAHHDAEYVKARIGFEATPHCERDGKGGGRAIEQESRAREESQGGALSSMRWSFQRIAQEWNHRKVDAAAWLCGLLLGRRGGTALRKGLFRTSGECHRWMYDRFSLGQILEHSGFVHVRACTAFESRIEGFASFGLDVVGERVRKPDSLFMEAVKP